MILLSLVHLQILLTCRLAAARGNRGDTTLATFNVGLVPGVGPLISSERKGESHDRPGSDDIIAQ